MTPLEIEAGDARPMFAAIGRSPDRRFKSRRVENIRIAIIHRYIVHVTVPIQNLPPAFAAIFGKINSAAFAVHSL